MKLLSIATGLVALPLVFLAAPASAQSADGSWSGTTERGGPIQITISGEMVQSYVFRGQPVAVYNSKASGKTISFTAGSTGTVVLTKRSGKALGYSYSDTSGGSAKATLSK